MWLKTPAERRSFSLENPNHPLAKAFFVDGAATITGRSMTDWRALSLPAIYNAVNCISGDLATSPLRVYVKLDNGGREPADHPLDELLQRQPQPMVDAVGWRQAMQGHVLLRGNSYAEIITNARGRVTQLRMFKPGDVERRGEFYKVIPEKRRIPAENVLHVSGPGGDGVTGYSVIKLAKENWALLSALEEANTRFIANASRPSGFISAPGPISSEAARKLKSMWGSRNAGLDNVGKTPILDSGMTWQQVGVSAEDAQFLESRAFGVTDIARWFNIPPHKISDLENATYSNIEELSIDYVRGTLTPWAVRHECQMELKLLTPRERGSGLFIRYSLDGLLRGDVERRTEAYQKMFRMGGLTTNEMRAYENRNPVDGGDVAYISADMIPLAQAQGLLAAVESEPRVEARSVEYRSPQARLALRKAFRQLLTDAAGRMVRGEIRNIRRILKRAALDELIQIITAYYFREESPRLRELGIQENHPDFARRTMEPAFAAYAQSVAAAAASEVDSGVEIDVGAFVDLYTDGFVDRYSARSRRDLTKREPDAIELRLAEWLEGSPEQGPRLDQVAAQETVKVGDAVARQIFIASGVASLVWRTLGDSCPYCVRLNGRRVGSAGSFIQAGEAFEGEGTDVPLVPKNTIRHAPAHRGCDCTIVPGL